MTEQDITVDGNITEPTESGWYAYSGGNQFMIFHLAVGEKWDFETSSFVPHRQWSVHIAGTADDCHWGYIAQALGVWDLVKIELPNA